MSSIIIVFASAIGGLPIISFFITIVVIYWCCYDPKMKLLEWGSARNVQEQAFSYQKLFWPITVGTNRSSDLKIFANSRPSASNFKSFSRTLEHFFLKVGQNSFGNKIPFFLPEMGFVGVKHNFCQYLPQTTIVCSSDIRRSNLEWPIRRLKSRWFLYPCHVWSSVVLE